MVSVSYIIGEIKLAFPTHLLLASHAIQAGKTFSFVSFLIHKLFHFTDQIAIACSTCLL